VPGRSVTFFFGVVAKPIPLEHEHDTSPLRTSGSICAKTYGFAQQEKPMVFQQPDFDFFDEFFD
jgi:hypothetical protein